MESSRNSRKDKEKPKRKLPWRTGHNRINEWVAVKKPGKTKLPQNDQILLKKILNIPTYDDEATLDTCESLKSHDAMSIHSLTSGDYSPGRIISQRSPIDFTQKNQTKTQDGISNARTPSPEGKVKVIKTDGSFKFTIRKHQEAVNFSQSQTSSSNEKVNKRPSWKFALQSLTEKVKQTSHLSEPNRQIHFFSNRVNDACSDKESKNLPSSSMMKSKRSPGKVKILEENNVVLTKETMSSSSGKYDSANIVPLSRSQRDGHSSRLLLEHDLSSFETPVTRFGDRPETEDIPWSEQVLFKLSNKNEQTLRRRLWNNLADFCRCNSSPEPKDSVNNELLSS